MNVHIRTDHYTPTNQVRGFTGSACWSVSQNRACIPAVKSPGMSDTSMRHPSSVTVNVCDVTVTVPFCKTIITSCWSGVDARTFASTRTTKGSSGFSGLHISGDATATSKNPSSSAGPVKTRPRRLCGCKAHWRNATCVEHGNVRLVFKRIRTAGPE